MKALKALLFFIFIYLVMMFCFIVVFCGLQDLMTSSSRKLLDSYSNGKITFEKIREYRKDNLIDESDWRKAVAKAFWNRHITFNELKEYHNSGAIDDLNWKGAIRDSYRRGEIDADDLGRYYQQGDIKVGSLGMLYDDDDLKIKDVAKMYHNGYISDKELQSIYNFDIINFTNIGDEEFQERTTRCDREFSSTFMRLMRELK